NMNNMFKNCGSLTTIYAEEWDTSQVTSDTDMFLGCEQVVGKSEYAITTPFDPNRIGKEVATPNNGYFTVPNLEEWNATVKLVNEDNQVLATKDFLRTNRKPEITTENLNEFMPNGYELVDENSSLTVTQDRQVFEVEIRKIPWILELEYQTVDGAVVKTEVIQVTQLNPVVTAQMITDGVPTGYELVDPANDWTATMNKDKLIVKVREIEWTITIEFITENAKGIVEIVVFTVGNLNPVIEARQIIDAIPAGYYAPSEIQDLRATRDGEVFQVVVVKIEEWEGIVHFVDQNGVTVKTEVYSVTNENPIIHVEELEKALPIGAILVNPLTELTLTKDKEEFIIEVVMPIEEEPEQPGIDDDTTTDEVQPEGSVEGVQTGDATQMGLWTMIMGGSIGVLAYLKRKKRNI
ncbi:MAG: hypothetical protein K2L08_06240, partial [Erysipelotrichaceae bacterium]|nr:hypothetical protein [Erysipelotrichaceae bacterium]